MPTKEELERRDLTELAVLCQKVADDPSIARGKARQLHEEWVRLIQETTPPLPALREQQEVEAQNGIAEEAHGRISSRYPVRAAR